MNALDERLNRIEYWNVAETAFKAVMDFVKHGDSWIADKEVWVLAYNKAFPFCAIFTRQLDEALQLASLLTNYPQFDYATPRYIHSGKTFFMELFPETRQEENRLIVKRANYTDADTGKVYHLEGRAWEKEGRIYLISYLNGLIVGQADYMLFTDNLTGMRRFTGSDKVIDSAFNIAENALFAKLELIPF